MNNSIVAWCKTQTDIDHRKIEKAFRKIYENDNDYLDALKSIRKTYILQKRKFEASLEDAEYSSQRNIFELLWVPCLTYRIDSIEKKIQNIEK